MSQEPLSDAQRIAQLQARIEELETREKRYRRFIDSLPLLLTMVDVIDEDTFHISLANINIERASGMPSPEGKAPEENLPQREADLLKQGFQDCLKKRDVVENLAAFNNAAGEPVWVHTMLIPNFEPDGTISSITSIGRDVTAQKLAEQRAEEEQRAQQALIEQQAQTLAQVSTPMLSISDSTVVMPLIGTIDSQRASFLFETLLNGVASSRARNVILDITGVSVVDTQVANVIIQAAQSVRLLGAEVILSGIRPEVAQVLVSLGIDFSQINTRSTLRAAIASTA